MGAMHSRSGKPFCPCCGGGNKGHGHGHGHGGGRNGCREMCCRGRSGRYFCCAPSKGPDSD